jgi:uncharacterized integral membrane protein
VQLLWIFSLCFALLIAVFAVQNTAPVSVNLLFWRFDDVAVAALVLAAAALGALTTYLFGLSRDIRQRLSLRSARSTARNQDALIEELRARIRDLESRQETSPALGIAGPEAALLPEADAAALPEPSTLDLPPTTEPRHPTTNR